jgi:RNA polymerase sigma-70 factor (ECF subfamily)
MGLLALMLLHESRRKARTNENGDIILLTEQNRQLWDRGLISAGQNLLDRAGRALENAGPYVLQAAISAEHARAARAEDTDWQQIVRCYDGLWRLDPSPVIELNRAVAVSMQSGPAAGLELVDAILARGELLDYHFAHAARADFCKRLGRKDDARTAYEAALALARQEPERRFITKQIQELE